MFNVPVVGFVISFKKKKSIRALLLCYTTSQNIFPNSHFFPLFHLLSGLVVDLFKRELTGTSKNACMWYFTGGCPKVRTISIPLSAICWKHAVISICKIHLIQKKKKKKSHLPMLVNVYLVPNDNLILTFFFQNLGEQMALLNPQSGLFL